MSVLTNDQYSRCRPCSSVRMLRSIDYNKKGAVLTILNGIYNFPPNKRSIIDMCGCDKIMKKIIILYKPILYALSYLVKSLEIYGG